MMNIYDIKILRQVTDDLIEGKKFYDSNQPGVGTYFFDTRRID